MRSRGFAPTCALIVLVAACGAGNSSQGTGDGGGGTDGGVNVDAAGCTVVLAFDPMHPIADASARGVG